MSATAGSDPLARLLALRALPSRLVIGLLSGTSADGTDAALCEIWGSGETTRAVIRIERKGRGGKEATIIDKLGLSPKDLELWCKDLKQALGYGGSVDGELIILQGDLRPRLPQVLTAKGVGKVTVG